MPRSFSHDPRVHVLPRSNPWFERHCCLQSLLAGKQNFRVAQVLLGLFLWCITDFFVKAKEVLCSDIPPLPANVGNIG